MDEIQIRGLSLFAYHGVNPEEKRDGQRFVLDVTCTVDLTAPCRSDRVEDTVSYAKVIKTLRRVMTQAGYDLIERAAEVCAQAVLTEYPPVQSVTVTLKKPDAPMQAEFEYVAVKITRHRGELQE